MNGLDEMSTPMLQDWWEHYVCPACMSTEREARGLCSHVWHSISAVTYECASSAVSPISIPVADLQRAGLLGIPLLQKYGRMWRPTPAHPRHAAVTGYV